MITWFLPSIGVLLSLIGLVTLRSVTPSLVPIQIGFVLIGWLAFCFAWKIGFKNWLNISLPLYLGLCLLLILTLVTATVTRGTARWLDIGGIHIQGSQLAVPIVGLVGAYFIDRFGLRTIKSLLGYGLIVVVPAILIVIAPDLGTTLIFLVSMISMAFISNIKTELIVAGIGIASILGIIAWSFFLAPYQKQRISSFIQPSADLQGAGYNARQALIAVGSGQLVGRGLGQGVQSHLRFLPERHTDFIFASLSEEWGFVGSGLVLALYAGLIGVIVYRSWLEEPSPEYYFLVMTAVFIVFQITVNIGMNMQLVPITGLTLPMISYGGSSFITFCLQLGIIQSSINKKRDPKTQHFT